MSLKQQVKTDRNKCRVGATGRQLDDALELRVPVIIGSLFAEKCALGLRCSTEAGAIESEVIPGSHA
jgi:hypothetical protein